MILLQILKKGVEILNVVYAISELDISFMVANQSLHRNYICPKISNHKILEIIGGRHPVVEHQMRLSEDSFISNDCILNNVKMYDDTIDNHTVENAAREIGIHDFISSLPNSYEYVVGERGITLSVGQRQLIAFLRAYIRNPKIIILDEATSSIDSESEELLQAALKKMSLNRTIIIIAHRLSTITGADKIILLDKGNIIESGDHKSLIDQKGKYFEMFNKQKNIELY